MPMTRKRSWGVMALNDCRNMADMRSFGATVSVAMACSLSCRGRAEGAPGIHIGILKERNHGCE